MDKQVNFLGDLCQLIHPMFISDFILDLWEDVKKNNNNNNWIPSQTS